jgi:formylglycine-generating enzyme required for sulfatase activity
MVALRPGSFRMGSPESEPEHETNESPLHEVTIARPFAIGRYEVTVGEFRAFVRDTGRTLEPGCATNEADVIEFRPERSWLDPGYPQTELHPVTCVSWNDAVAYAEWLSARTGRRYRLPGEAEWEYAARAGSAAPFAWGAQVTTDHANYDGRYTYAGGAAGTRRMASLPVGSFAPNAFGLYDVAGNVWEWVADCRHTDYVGAPGDGSPWLHNAGGVCQSRMRRGGSWDGYAKSVRSANRYWNRAGFRSNYDGFRVAREL